MNTNNENITNEGFENDSYTFTQLLFDLRDHQIMTETEAAIKIVNCIAAVGNKYIIKQINTESQKIEYIVVNQKTIQEMLNFDINLRYNENEFALAVAKARSCHKAIPNNEYQLLASNLIFKKPMIQRHIKQYVSVDVVATGTNCFGLFRPPYRWLYTDPEIKYNRELAIEFIEFIKSRIINPEAWIDQINTHKYQLMNPNKRATRFYINFESDGNSGKTFSSAGIGKMYGSFAKLNVDPKATKEIFNGWIANKKYIAFEEAESENYNDKEVNQFIKRWTNNDLDIRAMYKDRTEGKNYAIGVMASNDPGLYGLTRSDNATKRRIVVALYKPNTLSSIEWEEKSNMIDDVSFGYSLYKYIYEEWKIDNDYSPNSFVSSYDVWSELASLKKSPVETFNELLQLEDNEYHNPRETNYNIVKIYEKRNRFFYIELQTALENFKKHLQLNNNKAITAENFKKCMVELGWSYSNKKRLDDKQKAVFYRDDFQNADNELPEESLL